MFSEKVGIHHRYCLWNSSTENVQDRLGSINVQTLIQQIAKYLLVSWQSRQGFTNWQGFGSCEDIMVNLIINMLLRHCSVQSSSSLSPHPQVVLSIFIFWCLQKRKGYRVVGESLQWTCAKCQGYQLLNSPRPRYRIRFILKPWTATIS